jgi:hypothetical protein
MDSGVSGNWGKGKFLGPLDPKAKSLESKMRVPREEGLVPNLNSWKGRDWGSEFPS